MEERQGGRQEPSQTLPWEELSLKDGQTCCFLMLMQNNNADVDWFPASLESEASGLVKLTMLMLINAVDRCC